MYVLCMYIVPLSTYYIVYIIYIYAFACQCLYLLYCIHIYSRHVILNVVCSELKSSKRSSATS